MAVDYIFVSFYGELQEYMRALAYLVKNTSHLVAKDVEIVVLCPDSIEVTMLDGVSDENPGTFALKLSLHTDYKTMPE